MVTVLKVNIPTGVGEAATDKQFGEESETRIGCSACWPDRCQLLAQSHDCSFGRKDPVQHARRR